MCLFYAIEKKWIQKVSMCTISILQCIAHLHWVPLNSSLLINTNKTYISYQSYVFISFSLSYHKVIISHTLGVVDISLVIP